MANEKAYFVVSGTSAGYSNEDLTAALNAVYFDLQQNGTVMGKNEWARMNQLARTVTLGESGAWTIKFDITSLSDKGYTAHFIKTGDGEPNDNNVKGLLLTDKSTDGHTVKLGEKTYKLVNKNGEEGVGSDGNRYWGNVGLEVNDPTKKEITATSVDLESDSTHVYLVLKGSSQNYTKETLQTALQSYYFDFQTNGYATNGTWNNSRDERITNVTVTYTVAEDLTWTAKFDVTNMDAYGYQIHFGSENSDLKISDKSKDGTTLTLGNKKYTLVNKFGSGDAADYYGLVALRITEEA